MHELAQRLVDRFRVVAVVPSAVGAARRETLDGVEVIRFRYAPRSMETLVNDGGILANLRRARWKYLLLPAFVISQWVTAALVARQRQVHAVHAHWLLPQGVIARLLQFVVRPAAPYLVTSHGADLFALRGRAFAWIKRRVVERAAEITVVSGAMRDELGRLGVASGRVHIHPMGVDLRNRFTPGNPLARSRDEILFVGRLVGKKGLTYLIDAMPAILSVHPGAFLSIVGFGPEEAACREQVARLGLQESVRFVGAVAQAELPMFYRRAAVFVAPFVQTPDGDQEGLGLVLVEAAGCGCPVVVSDLPAVKDVFSVHPPAAFVRTGSPADLADAICQVLASPPDTAELRASLLDRFDWGVVADGYVRRITGMLPAGGS